MCLNAGLQLTPHSHYRSNLEFFECVFESMNIMTFSPLLSKYSFSILCMYLTFFSAFHPFHCIVCLLWIWCGYSFHRQEWKCQCKCFFASIGVENADDIFQVYSSSTQQIAEILFCEGYVRNTSTSIQWASHANRFENYMD